MVNDEKPKKPKLTKAQSRASRRERSAKKGKISLDSAEIFSIKRGQEVCMKQSSKFLKLIHPTGHNFYEAYRNKLGWGLGIIKD